MGLRQRQAFAVAICRGCADELKAESSKATGREIAERLDDVSEHLDGELGQIRHGLHVLQSAIPL